MGSLTADSSVFSVDALAPLKRPLPYKVPGLAGGVGGGGLSIDTPSPASTPPSALPVFTTPQSILFTDLTLRPGHPRTFYYSLQIPAELPPSASGRLLRISYRLLIGLQQTSISHRSLVFSVPLRLSSRGLIWDGHPIISTDVALVADSPRALPPRISLQEPYVDTLLATLHSASRVSYDICKNEEHVAELYLQRNVWRVGETVVGYLEFDLGAGCYHVSVSYILLS